MNINLYKIINARNVFYYIKHNLIDNASQNVSKTNSHVYIQLLQQYNDFIITVSNSFDIDFTLVQEKGKEHGYGL